MGTRGFAADERPPCRCALAGPAACLLPGRRMQRLLVATECAVGAAGGLRKDTDRTTTITPCSAPFPAAASLMTRSWRMSSRARARCGCLSCGRRLSQLRCNDSQARSHGWALSPPSVAPPAVPSPHPLPVPPPTHPPPQVHDLWHVLFGCHTNAFGEVALKAVEFVQVGGGGFCALLWRVGCSRGLMLRRASRGSAPAPTAAAAHPPPPALPPNRRRGCP